MGVQFSHADGCLMFNRPSIGALGERASLEVLCARSLSFGSYTLAHMALLSALLLGEAFEAILWASVDLLAFGLVSVVVW
jgi:hypothetical protein